MLKALTILVCLQTSLAWAFGPLPHERTNLNAKPKASTGRYIYLGDVPKFEGQELEITVSKMALTTRVTAFVTQARMDSYARQLFLRWKNLNDALNNPSLALHPLVNFAEIAKGQPRLVEAWARIAGQYTRHILEKQNPAVVTNQRNRSTYGSNSEEDLYKQTISKAYFQYLFDSQQDPERVLADNKLKEQILSVENSIRLFNKHLGHLFTQDKGRSSYIGYLTFVYPIAATTNGPFSLPRQGIYDLKTTNSMESRIWSEKWEDEFGGFPFLLIEWNGVAFHGPITTFSPLDVWYLKRGYVSHGCHRMDSNDILEMRALLPYDLKQAASKIKVSVLNYFDVIDWNKDGQLEVIDVNFYNIPMKIRETRKMNAEKLVTYFSIENQKKVFFRDNKYSKPFYNFATGMITGAPKYVEEKKKLVVKGKHGVLPLANFEYRPNRIIQYVEEGVNPLGLNDNSGKYPPKYFQKY